ncbi:putative Deoxynucleotidyltransferase terminal-interacting protein 1 [Hypsibius exemplaris]|uniref:Deoxynucleotidyltransferase terminal-interacting protein 1 n=1 Tax=Hypsibius exemplaris TaxID=2072580 RepID=A0A1W0WXY4_HYPEX|nr:putative Deoxynucleotidyltransferase terminal-interacting protein 1 [Hypsibius exemplaris]
MDDPFLSSITTMPGKIELNGSSSSFSEEAHEENDLNQADFHNAPHLHNNDSDEMIWPYNERLTNVTNAGIAAAMSGRNNRTTNLSAAAKLSAAGARQNLILQDPGKSLERLRRTLQKFVNQEIHAVLQRYVKEYFEPAVENLKGNVGQDLVTEDHLNEVLCSMLEEAKRMYEPAPPPPPPPSSSTAAGQYVNNSSPYSNISEGEQRWQEPFARYGEKNGQRRDSDGDSYSSGSSAKRPKTDRPKSKLAVARKVASSPKVWRGVVDLDSIDETTKFVLGSAANKVLGYAAARGRIYVKHPDLFKYVGDQEDKQWLYENKIMTAAGGKAFLIFSEDIKEILRTDDPTVKRLPFSHAREFTIPMHMLKKVQRAAADYAGGEARSRSGSNVSNISQGSRAFTEASASPPDPNPAGTSSAQNENQQIPPPDTTERLSGTMNYGDTTDGRNGDPFNDSDSPGGGFFSPLDRDVFDSDSDVFAHDDQEFSSGLSLDAINPTIGALDHSHELNQLDY